MTRACLPLALLFLFACGTDPAAIAPDAGETQTDAGHQPVDAGEEPVDAGEEPVDAGEEPVDAGEEPVDAGEDPADAGEDPVDAGEDPVDGGEDPVDAGEDPVEEELIDNGGFEQWGSTLPDAWFGSTSNIPSEGVLKDTLFPFEGDNACTLVNTSGTHKRFTTAARHAPAGRYDCTYMVRGQGEIRNAFFATDYSSYTSYTSVNDDDWRELSYEFNLANDVHDTFEFIFSVRNTDASRGHLVIDDVSCRRRPEPCDAVACEEWEQCRNDTAACEPRSGRCADDAGCNVWEQCNEDHRCEPRPGRCNSTQECAVNSPLTPVCNAGHHCEPGDPCAQVTCHAPRTCDDSTATCRLEEGVCVTTADCTGALPACDTATNTCVGADHPANIFPNGGFENWNTWKVPYRGDHWLPDDWYGLDGIGDTEIDPANVREYTTSVHGGQKALQLIGGQVADRFTSDAFDVPTGNYACAYHVRGKGSLRHRSYSTGGWSTQTPFVEIDSDEWQRIPFTMPGNVRDYRLIFYASRTDAARDHLQIDDVVCTKNAP